MTDLQAVAAHDSLSTFVDSISKLVAESRLHFESNGFRSTAVDPANAASVVAMLGTNGFESYSVDERATVGVNLQRLDEAIGFASGDDPVQLTTPEGDATQRLRVDTGSIGHELALIDTDSVREEPDIPDLELPATVVLEGSQIIEAVRAADTVSDHLGLTASVDGEAVTIEATGDTDRIDVEIPRDDTLEGTDVTADAHSKFSVEYLKDMVQPIPGSAEVELRLGDEMPLKMRWSYADDAGSVMYMLAPRIETR